MGTCLPCPLSPHEMTGLDHGHSGPITARRRSPRRRLKLLVLIALLAGGPAIVSSYAIALSDRPGTTGEPITPLPASPALDARKVSLGESLFADPRLSRDGKVSCLSCHDIRTNGADAERTQLTDDMSAAQLNTPTVFNAALDFRLNWEGNIRTLEVQADAALRSPWNMNSSADEAVARLSRDPDTVDRFDQAYGRRPDKAALLDAIASYERTLLTPGSRFDWWLQGDTNALSERELAGYELFKSLGCVSCHQGVNIGGNLYQRHGIFRPLASPQPEMVRVPSLRNVATTAPYFHDGSAPTLEDAVRRMAAAQLDQTLSDDQVGDITVFLGTLTGFYRGQPVTAKSE